MHTPRKQDSHFSPFANPLEITSRRDQRVQCDRKLTPCSEDLDALFGKSPHFSFRFQSSSLLLLLLFLSSLADPTLELHFKKHCQTNHFRLQPQTVDPPPAALLRLSSPLKSLALQAFLCPRSETPRIRFYMRVMTRGAAQLCSPGTKSVWNPDGGRTAAEISCDSDLFQDLCRAAPLPPLLPEHTGIPFNSLFQPLVKCSCLPSGGHSANCVHYPSIGFTTFLFQRQV